jgi:ELWxxDGT repeat protein
MKLKKWEKEKTIFLSIKLIGSSFIWKRTGVNFLGLLTRNILVIVFITLLAINSNLVAERVTLVYDIRPGEGGSYPENFIIYANKLYFIANDGTHGWELWSYNGTSSPILITGNICNGNCVYGSRPDFLTVFKDKLYFSANEGNNLNSHGEELWVYDGKNPPKMVADINPGYYSSNPEYLTVCNDKLYFKAFNYDFGDGLWVYDGVNPPIMVYGMRIENYWFKNFTVFNNKLYFNVIDSHGEELWEYDGTNNPQMVADINPVGDSSSHPFFLTVFSNKLYFSADDGTHGEELWEYDGANSPQMVADIFPGEEDSGIMNLFGFNNKLYFCAGNDYQTNEALWVYDGISAPTMVFDINPNPYESSKINFFNIYKNKLYFSADDGTHGEELWVYDGINEPQMVADLNPVYDSAPQFFVVFNEKLYFSAKDPDGAGRELWEYDGRNVPSIVSNNINPRWGSDPVYLIVFKNKLYFNADDYVHGEELWVYEITLPSLTTKAASDITTTTAISGGIITDNGGAKVTERGVCWSASPNPTIQDSKTTDGMGIGSFTSYIAELSENTTYFVRAYSTNSVGTSYGNEVTFTTKAKTVSVTIIEPQDGAEISGTVTIKASTTSTPTSGVNGSIQAVSKVEFYIDNTKEAEDTSAPYEHTWDTTSAAEGSHTIKAVAYNLAQQKSHDEIIVTVANIPAHISLNRTRLNFGAVLGGIHTGPQEIFIDNTGVRTLNWTLINNAAWLNTSLGSGTNSALVTVYINPEELSAGTYTSTIKIEDPNADNSPQNVGVYLTVYGTGTTAPSAYFETPVNGSTVMNSIPVTGWAIDDIDIDRIKIYRNSINGETSGLVYIGDAVLIEGARPDIEQAYHGFPRNYQAGWGYMLLTNMLPNQGNGTFTLHIKALDKEGNETSLGTKTIFCDNANAVKPFGTIDTPEQGGNATGTDYINFGWALTPLPNTIPTDGSTITVWVDGIPIGHPVYNRYRKDIATFFPGYKNSDGAVGYYHLDTTQYENGVHTIAWSVKDDAGNQDGIGSRYFTIRNTGGSSQSSMIIGEKPYHTISMIIDLPMNKSKPIGFRRGYNQDSKIEKIYPDEKGIIYIKIKELEPVLIQLNDDDKVQREQGGLPFRYTGYIFAGFRLNPLPTGSNLDSTRGVFYWQPGPGFVGEYRFVFAVKRQNLGMSRMDIKVNIVPKFSIER